MIYINCSYNVNDFTIDNRPIFSRTLVGGLQIAVVEEQPYYVFILLLNLLLVRAF